MEDCEGASMNLWTLQGRRPAWEVLVVETRCISSSKLCVNCDATARGVHVSLPVTELNREKQPRKRLAQSALDIATESLPLNDDSRSAKLLKWVFGQHLPTKWFQ